MLLTPPICGISGLALATSSLDGASEQDATSRSILLDSQAQLNKGRAAYNRGDYVEAFRLFRNISVFGEPEAFYRMGLMYAEGRGTRKSATLAAHWLKLAAKKNYPGAEAALASLKPVSAPG